MTDFATLLSSGNAWLFVPSAILLGALHGLEPGHSKTMMAAFIVAVRGTVAQAVLLGLSATLSHTAVVWAIALAGLTFGSRWNTQATEPYLQMLSALIIIGVAAWMIRRTWLDGRARHDHESGHDHTGHDHGRDDGPRSIATARGPLRVELHEDGAPPRWRVAFDGGARSSAGEITIETIRPDGARQRFAFQGAACGLESIDTIPEPHAFVARVALGAGAHAEIHDLTFEEHDHAELAGLAPGSADYMDAHQRMHARDIERRFGNGRATTGQIVMFGLTGGLIPCPASITVLLLCLQLKKFVLGATLVLCFGLGLALTMVSVGAAAALGLQQASRRWSGFSDLAARAPYLSSALVALVGVYTGYLGWSGLAAIH